MFIDYECFCKCVLGVKITLLKVMIVRKITILCLIITLCVCPIPAKAEDTSNRPSLLGDLSFFGQKLNLLRSRRCKIYFLFFSLTPITY